jgi:aerobic-type carbon monoxide dehydrogenase small subunit (CoxS/CutS family)
VHVSFFVNDRDITLDVDPRDVLVDVLRDELGLTGSKKSCGHGNCGSCTVLLEEHAVYACLVLAVECEGARITTIEGLAGLQSEGDARHRAAAAEVSRHIGQLDALEIKAHAAMPARPAGSGLVSSESRAP